MSGPQYMPLYVGDYLRDTLHLTAEQHGAYLLLLMACWTLGALPDEERKLARIAKLSPHKWKNFSHNFESFFEKKNDGLWHQKRIDRERQHVENVRAARSKSGSKGVANRWHARTSVLPIANDSKPEPEPELEPKPEDSPSLRSAESKSRPSAGAANRAAAPEDEKILQKGEALLGRRKRGLIRHMLTRHGEDRVRDALVAVERKQPADASAYFAACCEKTSTDAGPPEPDHSRPQSPIDDAMRQRVIERIRAEYATGDPPDENPPMG